MSPGANKRQTGTVPKAKATRKNSVPQEIVAPTRRDLQQHLNVSQPILIDFCIISKLSFRRNYPKQVTTIKNRSSTNTILVGFIFFFSIHNFDKGKVSICVFDAGLNVIFG